MGVTIKDMKQRIYTLDALKFFASILIVFRHFQQVMQVRYDGFNFYGGVFYFGYIVELFFILSGYFMGMSDVKNMQKTFTQFFKEKVFRLLIMAAISVILYCLLFWIYQAIFHECWFGESVGIWRMLASLLMIHQGGVLNIGIGANNVIWYIDVLLICYVIYWIILWLAKRWQVTPYYMFAFVFLLGLGIQQYGLAAPFLNGTVARGYYSFFFGLLLYKIIEMSKDRYLKWMACFVLLFVCLIAFTDIKNVIPIDNIVIILVLLVYPSIIVLCLKSKILNIIFNHKVFGVLGAISYEIYLWHVPVFLAMSLITRLGKWEINYTYEVMLVYTLIVILIASVLYYQLEKRIVRKCQL